MRRSRYTYGGSHHPALRDIRYCIVTRKEKVFPSTPLSRKWLEPKWLEREREREREREGEREREKKRMRKRKR